MQVIVVQFRGGPEACQATEANANEARQRADTAVAKSRNFGLKAKAKE